MLAFRMADGRDPALRTSSAAEPAAITQSAPQTTEPYADPYEQQAPSQPPLQSGTS